MATKKGRQAVTDGEWAHFSVIRVRVPLEDDEDDPFPDATMPLGDGLTKRVRSRPYDQVQIVKFIRQAEESVLTKYPVLRADSEDPTTISIQRLYRCVRILLDETCNFLHTTAWVLDAERKEKGRRLAIWQREYCSLLAVANRVNASLPTPSTTPELYVHLRGLLPESAQFMNLSAPSYLEVGSKWCGRIATWTQFSLLSATPQKPGELPHATECLAKGASLNLLKNLCADNPCPTDSQCDALSALLDKEEAMVYRGLNGRNRRGTEDSSPSTRRLVITVTKPDSNEATISIHRYHSDSGVQVKVMGAKCVELLLNLAHQMRSDIAERREVRQCGWVESGPKGKPDDAFRRRASDLRSKLSALGLKWGRAEKGQYRLPEELAANAYQIEINEYSPSEEDAR